MNSLLLRVIRSEQERREAPAVKALQQAYGGEPSVPELHSSFFRRLKNHLAETARSARLSIDVARLPEATFILPDSGHKMEELRSELTMAGISPCELCNLQQPRSLVSKIADIGLASLYAVYAAIFRMNLGKRSTVRTKPYLNVVFQYGMLRALLGKYHISSYWCILGDLSPFLISLSGAVKAENGRLLTWQYGYQDFKHFPASPDIAVVLNRKGIKLARADRQRESVAVFQRPTSKPKPVSFRTNPRHIVGIVLNAFSRADIMEIICRVQKQLQSRIIVKPHPRDNWIARGHELTNVEISNADALRDFCSAVDWTICGNTTATLKIRAMGFPVCQFFGFDHFFADHFGYASLGLIPSFDEVRHISEDKVRSFYERSQDSAALEELLGLRSIHGVRSLHELSAYVEKHQ